MHRTADDLESRFAEALARYRCTDASCGWAGLLPRQSERAADRRPAFAPDMARWKSVGRRAVRAWPLLLAGLATAAIVSLAQSDDPGGRAARSNRPLAPGEHHDGVALSSEHPLLKAVVEESPAAKDVERLALRQGCAWGKPGRNPYRGSVDQALLTAKLPPEVIQRIAHKVGSGQLDDRLEITNAGIRAERDERQFDPRNVALTYGRTLCVNARVNFPVGHVERASLYEAADRQGNLYSVMVPDVCGNVSVLGARMERKRKRVALPVLAQTAHAAPALMLVSGAEDDPARTVPEPGTLACVIAALAAWGGLRWRALRRRR